MDLVLYLAAGVFVAFVLAVWINIGARVWRQRERNAFADKLARDDAPAGPFAVYLRAFRHPAYVGVDLDFGEQLKTLILYRHTGADGRNGMRPLESVLAEILDKDLPLVGLGRPSAGLHKTGAGLVRTTDAEWKAVVTSLLDRCDLIVMAPAGTAGTAWEIEQLGLRDSWRDKTIYFMPNYQVELIRALQPYVAGYETLLGATPFVDKKQASKKAGSIILYALGMILRAPFRFIVDVAYGCVILFMRFAQSIGLRNRWGAARKAGRKHGLAFPGYSAKGQLFALDPQGKPQKLAELNAISLRDLRNSLLQAAKEARKRRERAAREAASATPVEEMPAPAAPLIEGAPSTEAIPPPAVPQDAPASIEIDVDKQRNGPTEQAG